MLPRMGNVFVHDLAAIDSVSRQTSARSSHRVPGPDVRMNVLLINAGAQLRTVAEREITPKMRRDGLSIVWPMIAADRSPSR